MKSQFKDILSIIDSQWISENPDTSLELIKALVHESNQRKKYIEVLHEKMLLTAALLNPGTPVE